MPTIKEWYQRVNAAWPSDVPPIRFDKGANAVRRLYRFITSTTFTGEIVETSGNRFSYARHGTFYLNTSGNGSAHVTDRPHGWQDLLHDLSHTLAPRVYDYPIKAHSREHAKLELRMVREVVKRGWLTSVTVRPAKQIRDLKAEKFLRIAARIVAWERKEKRAQTALKKLRRQRAYYQRVTGQTSATVH